MFHDIEEALLELQKGRVIIVCDDEDRENEGDFILLAEKAEPESINFMITYGKGLVCVPVDNELAKKLELTPMVEKNTDHHGTAFTVSIDHQSTTTGISAYERAESIKRLVDPQSKAKDFKRPGHIFPLIARKGGVLERPGHTEAAVDLAILCGAEPAGVICEIIKEDGTMARLPELQELANKFSLKMITIKDLQRYRKQTQQAEKC
jgi:3,4-dihydroxy 2-butanone 4-phosphate synthase/GTP cyclohydrolase II